MKNIIFFALAALLIILFVVLSTSENRSAFPVHFQKTSFIEGLKIIHKKDGNESWVLTARRADIDDHRKKAHLDDMEMTENKNGIVLYADSGVYDFTDKTLTITSTVTADNKSYSVTADTVTLDSLKHHLASAGNVKIRGKAFTIEGTGMEMTNRKQKVRILNNVTATFNNN